MSNVASASELHPRARRHCGSTEWFPRDLAIFGYTKETRQPTSEMSLLDLSLYFSTSNSDSWHRKVHIFFNIAAISGLAYHMKRSLVKPFLSSIKCYPGLSLEGMMHLFLPGQEEGQEA